MPIFEYKCKKCGTEFEKLVSSTAVKVKCVKCQSENVGKKFSVFAAKVAGPSCGMKERCPSADTPHCCSGGCCHH